MPLSFPAVETVTVMNVRDWDTLEMSECICLVNCEVVVVWVDSWLFLIMVYGAFVHLLIF